MFQKTLLSTSTNLLGFYLAIVGASNYNFFEAVLTNPLGLKMGMRSILVVWLYQLGCFFKLGWKLRRKQHDFSCRTSGVFKNMSRGICVFMFPHVYEKNRGGLQKPEGGLFELTKSHIFTGFTPLRSVQQLNKTCAFFRGLFRKKIQLQSTLYLPS